MNKYQIISGKVVEVGVDRPQAHPSYRVLTADQVAEIMRRIQPNTEY